MQVAVFKLFLHNCETSQDITIEDDFLFDYGLGKQKWGNRDLVLQVALKTFNYDNIKLFIDYCKAIQKYMTSINNIKEIQIEIYDTDKINDKKVFSFTKFHNFNAMYVNDQNPRFMIAFDVL